MQTTQNPSGMRSIKATQNFQMNYGVLKATTTPQVSYGKYFENTRRITQKERCSLCLNEKLEIARYRRHNLLNKRHEIIDKCRYRKKFALVLYDSKDWFKFSVTAFEHSYVRDHSFPKPDCFKSSWSQPGFGNRCFPVLVSLSGNHAYEFTVSPNLVDPQLTWN